MRALIAATALFLMSALGAQACGAVDDACEIENGTYYVVLPDDAPIGALMFLHGWGSSGAGSLKMTGMVRTFTEAGYVVIAPNGVPREGRSGRSWAFHPSFPAVRDEPAFLNDVKLDAAERFNFDPGNVILSGFSIGGTTASYAACARPDDFAAYAPIGGNLWRPHPESCAGPVRMFHTHGWSDGTVPLEGRVLRGGSLSEENALIQGDIFAALEIWRRANQCLNHKPDSFDIGEQYWRRAWDCTPGSALEFAMHRGGHSIPKGWAEMALAWFEGLQTSE